MKTRPLDHQTNVKGLEIGLSFFCVFAESFSLWLHDSQHIFVIYAHVVGNRQSFI